MKVLMASSEVDPFAKTGGLADVVGALPKALTEHGIESCVVMPFYRSVAKNGHDVKKIDKTIAVPIGERNVTAEVLVGRLPGSDVPVYFLKADQYFDRDELYGTPNGDFKDNCERFVFFSRGVLELVKTLNLQADVIHSHDWQAALIPVFMRTIYKEAMASVKSVMTIHNLAYQGTFWHWDMHLTGLDWKHFNWKELEFYGKINFLKGGTVFADAVTTVSKGYAAEIQTKEYGCGLEGVLRERVGVLTGIVNGIDYGKWDPLTDPLIPAKYGVRKPDGKAKCKEALQKKCRLDALPKTPLIGCIGRLAEQKGVDLVVNAVETFAPADAQFVILGTGEARYQDMLAAIGAKYPGRLSLNLAFNERLAHEIEAGSDMFLMPSRYEPCGLNQLYSLKYGTIPIVRRTGGLADTIADCTDEALKKGTGTGFVFNDYDPAKCREAVGRALTLFRDRRKWEKVVKTAMTQDWSWKRSAREYIELYCRL